MSLRSHPPVVLALPNISDLRRIRASKHSGQTLKAFGGKSPDFQIVYFAFDLLRLPLLERKAMLKKILRKQSMGQVRFTIGVGALSLRKGKTPLESVDVG